MPSNKEILEAQRFNRRRLITAFSSGIPSGKEISPSSPSRPLIAGLVICLIMLGGAAVASRFAPVLPQGWENSTLVVIKGTGARYFTIDGTLRPITNVTSARLLSEPGQFKISEVSASTISGIARGSAIGLSDVPDDVPDAASLASHLWLSCALPSGTHTWVGVAPEGPTEQENALVAHEGDYYLLSGGSRHLINRDSRTGVLIALGLDALKPQEVSAEWLNLFEQGSDLAPFDITHAGHPVKGMPARLSSAVIGSVIEVEDGDATRRYIVTGDAVIAPLSDTAERLHRISKTGELVGNSLKATVAELSSLTVAADSYAPSDWPASLDNIAPAEHSPCASLLTSKDGSGTFLTSWDTQAAVSSATGGQHTDPSAPAHINPVSVPGGGGALVRTSSGGTFGATMVITDDGKAHGLGSAPGDAIARLGWKDTDILLLPAPWAALVPSGVELLPQATWETVSAQ